MVVALLDESDLCLSDGAVEEIVDNVITNILSLSLGTVFSFLLTCPVLLLLDCQTFSQADSNGDGRIDPKEWEEFVKKNPASLRNMSLPYLQ
jgi:serine/threonine-protein phosphatase 2B regulatory subunit